MKTNNDIATLKYLPLAIAAGVLAFFLSYTTCGQESKRFVGIPIERKQALSLLQGECVPSQVLAPRPGERYVTIVLRNVDPVSNPSFPLELTHALILALSVVPESRVIEIGEEIPGDFKHAGFAEHNGQHPFNRRQIIAETIKPVTFCP